MLVEPVGVTGVVGGGVVDIVLLPWHPIIKATAKPATAKMYRTRHMRDATAPPAVSS